jgi:hypothetical protein
LPTPTRPSGTARLETFARNHVEVDLFEDRDEPGTWRVEYSTAMVAAT